MLFLLKRHKISLFILSYDTTELSVFYMLLLFFLFGYWCSRIGKCSTTNSCRQFSDETKNINICNITQGERYYCANYKIINDKKELSTIYSGIYCSSFQRSPGGVIIATCDNGLFYCMDVIYLHPPATPKLTPQKTPLPATPNITPKATLMRTPRETAIKTEFLDIKNKNGFLHKFKKGFV